MKVREAVRLLGLLDAETDLIISWWDADMFEMSTLSVGVFKEVSAKMDWSTTHEALQDIITGLGEG